MVAEDQAILDPRPLDQLRALARPGRPNVLVRLLTGYLQSVPGEVQQLSDAIVSADFGTCGNLAHGLKAVTGSVGGHQLSSLCGTIESLSKREDESALWAVLGDLSALSEATTAALTELLQSERGNA